MSKLPELGYESLGDLTKILHNQGVSDLSWLAVDEEDYKASQALPRQNLDIIPELQKALSHEVDEKVPSLIPLRPHTTVNSNPIDKTYGYPNSHFNLVPQRVATYVAVGLPAKVAAEKLQLEFSPSQLQQASSDVSSILEERGLLGNVYIDSKYLPRCAQDSPSKKLANTKLKRALFVLSSDKCNGCSCNKSGFCSSLKRQLVSEIPYGPKLASTLNKTLELENRPIVMPDSPISKSTWKEKIAEAFLKMPSAKRESSVQTIQTQYIPQQPTITLNDVENFISKKNSDSGVDAMPSPVYLKYAKYVMEGCDATLLAGSQNPEIQKLIPEIGILGHSYLDMDALGGCRNTIAFIEAEENSGRRLSPDFILRRSASCPICRNTSDGACNYLCSKTDIVTKKPDVTQQTFIHALQRAALEKRISVNQAKVAHSKLSSLKNLSSAVAYINLLQPVSEPPVTAHYTGGMVVAFNGESGKDFVPVEMNAEEVRRNVSQLMNIGLYGRSLQASILNRYSRNDLVQVPEIGARLSEFDGIQGEFFIDPTAYSDYGKGCHIGAAKFRGNNTPHVMASPDCTGCALQTAPSWCSKYSKTLIRSVPEEVKTASKKRFLTIIKQDPIENPVEKFQLSSEFSFTPETPKRKLVNVALQSGSITE